MSRTVSGVLLETIRRRGYTAYMLSGTSGVAVDSIQRFLNGQRGLNLASLDRLCGALGLELTVRNEVVKNLGPDAGGDQ